MRGPFGRFHHIGIAIWELEPTRTKLAELLGGQILDQGTDELLAVEWCWIQPPQSPIIELLAPLSKDTVIARFLHDRPGALHHLSFATFDLSGSAAHVRDVGLTVIGENRDHGGYEEVFVDPDETANALFHVFRALDGSLDAYARDGS